jgi:hypothetical protein
VYAMCAICILCVCYAHVRYMLCVHMLCACYALCARYGHVLCTATSCAGGRLDSGGLARLERRLDSIAERIALGHFGGLRTVSVGSGSTRRDPTRLHAHAVGMLWVCCGYAVCTLCVSYVYATCMPCTCYVHAACTLCVCYVCAMCRLCVSQVHAMYMLCA